MEQEYWKNITEKYNLLLDNENYDDLESALKETYIKGIEDSLAVVVTKAGIPSNNLHNFLKTAKDKDFKM
jgi:hypothetical protein